MVLGIEGEKQDGHDAGQKGSNQSGMTRLP